MTKELEQEIIEDKDIPEQLKKMFWIKDEPTKEEKPKWMLDLEKIANQRISNNSKH